ncbi:4-(cytidine 5'-diphospho)-2-C-methyl-D-erythritol kinase [Novosphingobium sp. FSY-8]|uniref:4-diphosphocytidyl-2-C-methyl-D-erythritol kinase n=1 Tax=Novosphingobium ovatum TaxID=1908523 RepID=A0ABW9XAN1_9SPHN|nr:4-(cytidine 5'-diphospho)-2-C-methyl-D-erythritol kinase [Novosphingobium ovatum]NBC35567.1 4-(cytidine 5'-diphospho)-2-C-methyl-D-erythritol kinase [Novosphingobium ovatum]
MTVPVLSAPLSGLVSGTAYAKINLALHLRRRRDDGYHELETLFAFVDAGDAITIAPADAFELIETGEFAAAMGPVADNLVTRAAVAACGTADGALPPLRIHVDKRLPVAAGLGGGSADAGAVLRLLGVGADRAQAIGEALGADVPACVVSQPMVGRGTGTHLEPLADHDLLGAGCLLVNPRVPLSTGPVFKAWDQIDHGPLPQGSARDILLNGRNDMEPPAIQLCPAIADVLAALRATAPVCARMSGSGATCFAIYDTPDAMAQAAAQIAAAHPGWWQMAGRLR